MKKTFFLAMALMILSLSATTLFARGMGKGMGDGGCGGPGMGMGMHKPFQHLEMLQYHFDLTNAQVDKIYKIDKEYMDKFHQNRNDADKIKELREKQRSEIESILTPDQKTKWNEFTKNRPVKDRDGGNCPGFGGMSGMPGMGIGFMQKDLKLTDDQIDKIYKIHRDNMDKFYQIRNDADKVRELRVKQDAEIEKILTAEQKVKWDEFKKNHPMNDKNFRGGKGGKGYHMMDDND